MVKDNFCCEEIVTTKEKVKNLAETITEIKQDLDEVKHTLGKNTQKLDDLIDSLKADKNMQFWALGFIITMCASFGVFLTKSAFDSRRDITLLQYQYSYEQANITKQDKNAEDYKYSR